MASVRKVLVFGASYGSLLAVKLLGAGHDVTLVCRASTAQLIERQGIRVRFPDATPGERIEVDSRGLPGRLSATAPCDVECADYDLVVLAMQEPQYATPEVREALRDVAHARIPCMSIMNMPPLAYLARIPDLDTGSLRHAYTDAAVWDAFDPARMTLCSPDPQAFRPPNEPPNVLEVRLPTNFKTATFASAHDDAMLQQLQADIEEARFPIGKDAKALPVKLKVHASLYVPFAKWSMLLAGNYRCVQPHSMRSIAAAVRDDAAEARAVYDWTAQVCKRLGARDDELVPFDKYAAAAASLTAPSSAARALAAGATDIERVDRLVQAIATGLDMHSDEVERTVDLIDAWLVSNRRAADARDSMPRRAVA